MKKIAIITYIDTLNNYGQTLQCYALQRFLRVNFPQFEVRVLYVVPNYEKIVAEKSARFRVKRFLKNARHAIFGEKFLAFLKRVKFKLRLRFDKEFARQRRIEAENLARQRRIEAENFARDSKRGFIKFKHDFIALHDANLEFPEAFDGYKSTYDADIYIVGSDQVWNDWRNLDGAASANFARFWLDFYTLKFLREKRGERDENDGERDKKDGARKISYAASFGVRKFRNAAVREYFADALRDFHAISVRESHNIATLREIGFESCVVPDPSALLTREEYGEILGESRAEWGNLAFVYMLGNKTKIDKNALLAALEAKYELLFANANVDFSCEFDKTCTFFPTPREWLLAMRECKCVVTNSFHGASYAIIMNTPFVALKLGDDCEEMNARFESLFEILGLQSRFVENIDEAINALQTPIDWEVVNAKLKKWREVGVEFLRENLNF